MGVTIGQKIAGIMMGYASILMVAGFVFLLFTSRAGDKTPGRRG